MPFSKTHHSILALALGFLAASCGESVTAPGPPASLDVVSGQDQTGVAGTELTQPLAVRIIDADNHPVPGVLVNFKVVSGGGNMFAGSGLTNADGIAKDRWTLGPSVADSQRVQARSVDASTGTALVFGDFRATATAGPASELTVSTAPSVSAPDRTVFAAQPVIHISDAHGNPVAGTTVTAAIAAGGGTLNGTTNATSSATGAAAFSNLSIAGIIGSRTLTFTAPGASAATATVLLTAGTATSIAMNGGNNQTHIVGALVAPSPSVVITDADGNAVAGVEVIFTPASGGSFLTYGNRTSDATGIATLGGWNLLVSGTSTIQATAMGLNGSPVTFSANAIALQSVAAGVSHACGLTVAGEAYCLGSNGSGQLGDGTTQYRNNPVHVAGGLTFSSLSAGDYHTCGISTGGGAYCWGMDAGAWAGATGDRPTPTAVAGGAAFTSVSSGNHFNCALTGDRAAYCWGWNTEGQLGNGSVATYFPTPVAVSGGLSFKNVSAGDDHACGITTPGAAYCWGDNESGELGNGTSGAAVRSPVAVSAALVFESVAAGRTHTCGIVTSGAAYCWGNNGSGQLGDGTTTSRYAPSAVAGSYAFRSVVAGYIHTCGLDSSGAAYCWGDDNQGEVDGQFHPTVIHKSSPLAVPGGLHFVSIDVAFEYSTGIATDGGAYLWGSAPDGSATCCRAGGIIPGPLTFP